MTKQMLLKKVHELIWANDDYMEQENLFKLQGLIDGEIIKEAKAGKLRITQLSNGYIKSVSLSNIML